MGYLGYDVVRHFEPIPYQPKNGTRLPKLAFLITDTLLIFDNIAHTIKVVANAHIRSQKKAELKQAYADSLSRINHMITRLKRVSHSPEHTPPRRKPIRFSSNMNQPDFEKNGHAD